jgi:hypothetical protein
LKGFKDTAEMRTDELMRAAKQLGFEEVFFLAIATRACLAWKRITIPMRRSIIRSKKWRAKL